MSEYKFEDLIEEFPIGMTYVPWQQLKNIYENLEEAYRFGTIFPELTKPFTGRRGVGR